MHFAVRDDKKEIAELLLRAGAVVDNRVRNSLVHFKSDCSWSWSPLFSGRLLNRASALLCFQLPKIERWLSLQVKRFLDVYIFGGQCHSIG